MYWYTHTPPPPSGSFCITILQPNRKNLIYIEISLNIMQQEPLLASFWKSSKSLFGSAVKYCRRCGQGTTKNERDTCKVCGLSSWISREDKDKLHQRWLSIGSVIPPPNSLRATPQRCAPRDPTIAKYIRSNYLFLYFYPTSLDNWLTREFKWVGVHPKNMFYFVNFL